MSSKDFSYKREVLRKIIHFSSSIFAFMLLFLGKSISIPLFIIIAILFFVADVLRLKNQHVQNIYNIFFDVVTRNSEKNRMTGASYVFLIIVLVTLLFDVKIAVVSLLIMSLADPVASLIGRGTVYLHSLPFSRLANRIIASAPILGGARKGEGSVLGIVGDMIDGR